MKSLPTTWATAPIGDLCDLKNGRAFKPSEWSESGLPIVRIQNLNNPLAPFNHYDGEWTTKNHLKGGELLFAWSGTPGTSFGAHIWRGGNALLNQHIFRVDFDNSVLDKRFFRYAINQKLNDLIDVAHGGAGLQHVTKGVFESTHVMLPPRNEQSRIADKLDSVLTRVDAINERLARVAQLLKRFRQSVLVKATSGLLTADCRSSSNCAWPFERADVVCTKVQSGGTPKAGFVDAGVPFLKVYNIVNQKIAFDYKPQFIPDEVHSGELKKSQVFPGDVLMNIVGPPLGKVAVAPATHERWNINQALTLFRSSDRISSEWLYIVLCEGAPIRSVLRATKGSVGQVNISLSQCRAFEFPVPSPVEQAEAVRRVKLLFDYADRLEARLKTSQAATTRLTPSFLAKAFCGELVPQDPRDEPAIKLLKRVQGNSAQAKDKRDKKRLKDK